ncbi:hypothetical protein [Kitasatospora sp. NPDC091207]
MILDISDASTFATHAHAADEWPDPRPRTAVREAATAGEGAE